jgi:predicted transcriptional regulator
MYTFSYNEYKRAMASTTLTVRLSPRVKKQLGRLANRTRRTKSFLAAEAISDFVAREIAIIDGINRGLDDLRAGRLVPHDAAMDRLEASIARVKRGAR